MAIKMIFFDVGGVLIGRHFETFLKVVAGKLGVKPEYLVRIRRIYHEDLVTGNLSVEGFLRTLKHEQGIAMSDDEMLGIWKSNYIDSMGMNEELYSFISSLNCRVGIISDVYTLHAQINKARGVYAGFNPCILSCDVQLSKSGKEIFLLALKACGLKAKECIFIDDKEKNVAAAKALGFNSILYKDNKQLFAELKKAGVRCIPY